MAFQESYSAFYNIFYKDKNYAAEAAYIHELIQKNISKKPAEIRLLDLACGTGRHLFELDTLGYKTEGSDIAEKMIEVARKQAENLGKNISFHNYSFQESYKIEKKFDVVISVFSAIDYLTETEDLVKTLGNIYDLLEPGGIFVFDYWNGNAVVRDFSPVKVLRKNDGNNEIMRISNTSLDIEKQRATVQFTCLFFENGVKQNEFVEVHPMRYFYFQEMETLLKLCKFEVVHKSTFMNTETIGNAYDWNISVVAKKA